jgi:hypothetical protein
MLRLAPNGRAQSARIEWRGAHASDYRTIATVHVSAGDTHGYFAARLAPPGPGVVRIAWRSRTGATFNSRAVKTEAKGSSSASAPALSSSATIAQTYSQTSTIPPCEFSPAELQLAESSASNNELQYDQGFLAAIEEARQQQASGACAHAGSSSTAPSAAAGTPAPAPAAPLARGAALHVGSPTAATSSGLPAPMVILLVFLGVLTVSGLGLGTARLRGWDPPWAARTRHSWSEAGYRLAGIWSEFVDWLWRGG